jgi:hypothetical protein
VTKKKEGPPKWDMKWKRPRKTKTNWKIPKSVWIIVGLLILFTGLTLATNYTNKKTAQPKTDTKKQTQKKATTTTTVTQKQQSSAPILAYRKDQPPEKDQSEKQNSDKSNNTGTNTQTNTSKENPPKSEPEVKTVYVYRDRPTNSQENPKSTTPKTTTPKTATPKTTTPKATTPKKTTPKRSSPSPKKPKVTPIDKRNVLKNGGFESGRLDYWDSWSPDGQGVVHSVVKDYPASGKYDLVHWHNRDYKQMSYQRLYNLPNGTYTLTGMVRSSKGQADLKLGVKDFDNTTNGEEKYVQLNTKSDPSKWKEFRVDNVVVKGGEAIVFTYSVAKAEQWAVFDNISFYRVK